MFTADEILQYYQDKEQDRIFGCGNIVDIVVNSASIQVCYLLPRIPHEPEGTPYNIHYSTLANTGNLKTMTKRVDNEIYRVIPHNYVTKDWIKQSNSKSLYQFDLVGNLVTRYNQEKDQLSIFIPDKVEKKWKRFHTFNNALFCLTKLVQNGYLECAKQKAIEYKFQPPYPDNLRELLVAMPSFLEYRKVRNRVLVTLEVANKAAEPNWNSIFRNSKVKPFINEQNTYFEHHTITIHGHFNINHKITKNH